MDAVLGAWRAEPLGGVFARDLRRPRRPESIGWAPSSFQKEIAGANLGIGLGAIAASVLGPQAAWTMFFVGASFLWSAAAIHIADMVRNKNFAINNAGPIFWWNILTPLTLFIALLLS
jgi:hypothetical protein